VASSLHLSLSLAGVAGRTSAASASGFGRRWAAIPTVIIDHDGVEAAELGDGLLDALAHPRAVAGVGLNSQAAAVELLHLCDRFVQLVTGRHRVGHLRELGTDVGCDNVGPLLREPDGVAASLAAGGARDQRDFALDTSRHVPCRCDVVWVSSAG
jgi:hypothetical protein